MRAEVPSEGRLPAPAVPPSRGPAALITHLGGNWSARSPEERLGLRLLLPVFGTVVVIATIPFVMALVQATLSPRGEFIGLDNFARALGNQLLGASLRQTAIYALI